IGGKLKQRGKLSGRMADALSWMLFGMMTLRRFEAEGRRPQDLPLVHWALRYSLLQVQHAFEDVYTNFDTPVVGWLLRYPGTLWLRLNSLSRGPRDWMDRDVAASIQQPGELYQRVALDGLGQPRADEPGLGRLLHAWRLLAAVQEPTRRVHKAMRSGEIGGDSVVDALAAAVAAGIVDANQAQQIREAEQARMAAIQVDEFSARDYYRDQPESAHADGGAASARAVNG